jgi:hypothetical protein
MVSKLIYTEIIMIILRIYIFRGGKKMKRKIVAIVVLMLMATTVVSATNGLNLKEKILLTSSMVDAPVWKKGDSWTYQVHEIILNGHHGNYTLAVYNDCTQTYTVTDTTGDNYIIKVTSKNLVGNASYILSGHLYRFKFTKLTRWTMEFHLRKTDLALVYEWWQWKGFVFWLYGKIGLPLPAQYELVVNHTYSPPMIYMPFPLTPGTNGTLPNSQGAGTGKCSLYWGYITLFSGPDIINSRPLHYTCEMTNITVPAGHYDAYNVSETYSLYAYYRSYYVPEVGNFAKRSVKTDYGYTSWLTFIQEMDLVSTTYTP